MGLDWLRALVDSLGRKQDGVLITVAHTEGSAPRQAGTSMFVSAESHADTIGGGHLEWQAIRQARTMLNGAGAPTVQRFNLGARLGQCCGGVVWLIFERVAMEALGPWRERLAALERRQVIVRWVDSTCQVSSWEIGGARSGTHLAGDQQQWTFSQEIAAESFPVVLFGAGHVARALIAQLRLIGAGITWIDQRDDAFSGVDTSGIRAILTDSPEGEVATAPPGTYFLVMTHSHALDYALCEEIFTRSDFAYFGLIGSRSKRVSFGRRLMDRGLPPERLDEMTCPIGIAGIASKAPHAIALSVAAQLLQIHTTRQLLIQAARPHLINVQPLPE